MIDTRLLLEDFDATAARLARRGVPAAEVAAARDLALRRREAVRRVDAARAEMNAGASEVGSLVRAGKREEAERRRQELAASKSRLGELEQDLRAAEAGLEEAVLHLPNLPTDDVPDGVGAEANKVVRVHGFDPADYEGREWLPHWEVAASLGIFDAERAAKLSGAMFSLLRGGGARLLRALVQLGLDLNRGSYLEVAPPHLVRTEVIGRTGHLTKFDSQAYCLRDDELWLVPTAEVALMGMHQGEIIPESQLPLSYMAYTVCWRREAGAAGKETRGMQRLHEFHKVELVRICRPEDGDSQFEALLADAERPLQVLGLPYRVVQLCAGDLGMAAARTYDLEVYAPGVDRWLEVSSVSLVTDFQSRRGGIRLRRESGGVELCWALNGSGLATPRVWAAVVEHGQERDGTVRLPDALVPYMGGEAVLAPRGG